MRAVPLLALLSGVAVAAGGAWLLPGERVSNGHRITPPVEATEVASFPANLALSPDGTRLAVVSQGYRQQISILDATDGRMLAAISLNAGAKEKKDAAYFGLRWAGDGRLFVARGHHDRVTEYTVSAKGEVALAREYADPADPKAPTKHFLAGFALLPNASGNAPRLVAARNEHAGDAARGELALLSSEGARTYARVGGFPLDVAAVGDDLLVTSERDGIVSIVRPSGSDSDEAKVDDVKVGRNPTHLLPTAEGVYVAVSGSDTVVLLDPRTRRIVRTILLRPTAFRGLPSCTPLGMATDAKNLYVALGDLNAVAVVERKTGDVEGYLPTGWYPTAVAVTPGGKLFVANAKGDRARNPNAKGGYVLNILEGTVSRIDLATVLKALPASTRQVLANAGADRKPPTLTNPGIRHVIYIVKENRTYDNVFGDIAGANGDPSITLFPREITPNQHALAERFGILDNFYVCADVSADGWNWSTSGMINEYTARNVPYNYSGRGRAYDQEGETNGYPVDLHRIPDVAESPGGYIWDAARRARVSLRNYGMFVGDVEALGATKPGSEANEARDVPNKRALVGATDESFRQYDLEYPDSEAFLRHGIEAPHKLKRFGAHGSPSRFSEWKREFDGCVKSGKLPALTLLRLPRDHTRGTATGASSARAMVADNDYAVGQVVDAVSHSPFWSSTAICVLEDDAQAGLDHVDAHRSIALVVSPYNRRAAAGKVNVDSRFFNTDSMLRTIELLLGMKPMSAYDATADPIDLFARTTVNAEPYAAILPARSILSEVNARTSYRAADSLRLIDRFREESAPDVELNDILWHSIRGRSVMPTTLHATSEDDEEDEEDERDRDEG